MTQQQQRRRHSGCHRHPSADAVSGFCPSCLHERLSTIVSPSHSVSSNPDLRRCKSYKQGSLRAEPENRRKSCDVRPRTSLSNLFQSDGGEIVIESARLGGSEIDNEVDDEDGEYTKTMKEHIELEFEIKKQSNSLWGGAASVFTQKLQKWRLKQKQENKKEPKSKKASESHGIEPSKGLMIGRRSCDTESRFLVDDQPRFSLDEPRASWDGYMVARTIPRLAPMLSVIENAMLVEDETNSVSESSSSQRRNSFDCSSSGKSSGKHRLPVEIEQHKEFPVAKFVEDKAHVNFNLCEDPLKNTESGSKHADSLKRKVLKILGFKSKSTETRSGDAEAKFCEESIRVGCEVISGRKSDVGSYRTVDLYHRSPKVAEIKGPERNRSVRYSPSPSNFENGLLRFHLAPPLSRKKKLERRSVSNSQPNTKAMSRLN